MKTRHVYSAPDIETARAALAAARQQGIPDADLSLVARSDIEITRISDRRKEADTDMKPAMLRGICIGLAVGALVALAMTFLTSIPLTALLILGGAIGGALLGGLGATLSGASVPDPLRRQFAAQIEAGQVLLIIDATSAELARIDGAVRLSGATLLPYEGATAAT